MLAVRPGLGRSGIDPKNKQPPVTAAAGWPHDELKRALLWLAVCDRSNKKTLDGSGFYRNQAARLTGGDISNGSLIAAAYMCDLTRDYECDGGEMSVEHEVSAIESVLDHHAPEAHEGWGWCADCAGHHAYPHDDGEYIEASPSPEADRARDWRLRGSQPSAGSEASPGAE